MEIPNKAPDVEPESFRGDYGAYHRMLWEKYSHDGTGVGSLAMILVSGGVLPALPATRAVGFSSKIDS